MNRNLKAIGLFALATFIVGFRTAVARHQPPGPKSAVGAVPRSDAKSGLDSAFLAIEAQVPGFAGLYIDESGEPVVLTKHDGSRVQTTALVQAFLSGRRHSGKGIKFAHANYSIAELTTWREALRSAFYIPGVVTVGIQHQYNRILVGVVGNDAERAVLQRARDLGIPREAIRIEDRQGINIVSSLHNDNSRPVRAGTSTEHVGSLGCCYPCTIGFNAFSNYPSELPGELYITASHCTRYPWDNTTADSLYKRDTTTNYVSLIGTKAFDRPGFSCPDSVGASCRYADAAAVRYIGTVHPDFGKIAIPSAMNDSASSISGSLYVAYDDVVWPLVGDSLDAIGISTGRKRGVVTCASCDEYAFLTNKFFLMQAELAVESHPGDSGGPVFRYNAEDGTASLAGVIWAGGVGVSVSYFSPIGAIEGDLGTLRKMDRFPGDRGPLSVSAIAPGIAPAPYEEQSYSAVLVGGTGTLTCTWTVDEVEQEGADDCTMAYTNTGAPFTVAVTVHDAHSHYSGFEREVTPYNPCYPYDCAEFLRITSLGTRFATGGSASLTWHPASSFSDATSQSEFRRPARVSRQLIGTHSIYSLGKK